ncbi:hypothetical protein AGMMS49938_14360 [Fibrobacterales bacterium]|nr:hypothetical protein AGMMS49938_14360 [Fibrobacterales bacterium]
MKWFCIESKKKRLYPESRIQFGETEEGNAAAFPQDGIRINLRMTFQELLKLIQESKDLVIHIS